jgi:hypothetical protein
MATLNRQRLVFGLYLLVLIAVFEIATGRLHVPAWPAFVAMVFFFAEHMDPKKVPHILIGGAVGIACILLARPVIGALAPLLGADLARLAFILLLVYAIVAFGEMVPVLLNNYAFMYLTIVGIAVQLPSPNPFLWMAITVVGGAILIGGVIAIGKLMGARPPAGGAGPGHGAEKA